MSMQKQPTVQYQVGSNLTHFSEIVFSSPPNINVVFGFNKYLTNTELSEALLRTPYPSGETYTAQALNLARTSAFTSANGARTDVPKIAVVLTDGKSTYPNDTSREAEDLKKSGAVVLAIGVSQRISPEELNTIATLPHYVFHVDDFAGLQSIINNVSKTVCTVVAQKAESSCVSLYRCLGRRDGDYPACSPECQEGYYYSCVNGYAYQRPCALGKYVDSNNEYYTALMVYDPATKKCQLTSSYCPRKTPKPYVAPNPPTAAPKSRPTECIQYNCKNKEDNDYPACIPECQQGYFYSCVNEFAYKRECALGWFIDANNKPYTERLIYDPAKGSCEYDVPSCPRDRNSGPLIDTNSTQKTPTATETCVRDKSCEGFIDGFYPPCDAECCNAKYYECSNHKTMELECDFGWFLDANNQRYIEKLIYNPIRKTCEYSAPSCSRGQIPAPELPATTTTTPEPTTTT
ncbi:vitrin, partial [Biomphalaria glabrata]